jgi:cathepsin B
LILIKFYFKSQTILLLLPGATPALAFKYWVTTGLVSGGDYGSNEGCVPFSFIPCEHPTTVGSRPICSNATQTAPACQAACTNANYPTPLASDKRFGLSSYTIPNDEVQIMTEIFNNGPVVGVYQVYEDFLSYQSGIYQYTTGAYIGVHAIRIIGWGVENGTKYWLVANSW